MPSRPHISVIGAGAFGGWTALHLLRRGARVTLLDAWGPGHSRSSSGGETRIIRGAYGPDRLYVEWVARSFELWRGAEIMTGETLYRRTGVLWMCGEDDGYVRDSLPYMEDVRLPVAELSPGEARARFPQIDFDGVRTVYFEEKAGALFARRACQTVVAMFEAEGGEYRQAAYDAATLTADLYVFACGPWLAGLFPDVIGERFLRNTRQEVFFFGTPAGDPRFQDDGCPIWIDLGGERIYYGIPGNEHRGFKVADDTRGEPIDPTTGERTITPALLEAARAEVARRFPALAGAPLVESRVCQYENTPDGHILFDRHPEDANVWFLGGGSGHGFKIAPALGEYAAGVILDGGSPLEIFKLDRPGHGEATRTQFER
ncbi:MAG TPA: FAD-dependent oxidoreductase [Thermoanaerobaculia bacterium]|nr:FAD-dependent oxidoreductase [Thermoanaerobaculia bacterium]